MRLEAAEVVGSLQAPLEKVRGDVNAKKNNRVRWLRIGQRHDDQGVTFFPLQLSSRRFNHHQLGLTSLPIVRPTGFLPVSKATCRNLHYKLLAASIFSLRPARQHKGQQSGINPQSLQACYERHRKL